MANTTPYHLIVVESFYPDNTSGRHGKVNMRPVAGQPLFSQHLFVECSRTLVENYPVGTKFRIKAKLNSMQGIPFIYSYFGWDYEIINEQVIYKTNPSFKRVLLKPAPNLNRGHQ